MSSYRLPTASPTAMPESHYQQTSHSPPSPNADYERPGGGVGGRDGDKESHHHVDFVRHPPKGRSRRGLEKRFQCDVDGCGKRYSRAEHLQRHKLNHSSGQLYHCAYPGCARHFVRPDLLKRHEDRHAARAVRRPGSRYGERSYAPQTQPDQSFPARDAISDVSPSAFAHLPVSTEFSCRDGVAGSVPLTSEAMSLATRESLKQQGRNDDFFHSLPNATAAGGNHSTVEDQLQSQLLATQSSPEAHGRVSHLIPDLAQENASRSDDMMTPPEFPGTAFPLSSDAAMFGQSVVPDTIPMFGSDMLNGSMHMGMPDEFLNYLFATSPPSDASSWNKDSTYSSLSSYPSSTNAAYQISFSDLESFLPESLSTAPVQSTSAETHQIQPDPGYTLSQQKHKELVDFIIERFYLNRETESVQESDAIFSGDPADDSNVLSRRMIQTYIHSYWNKFSEQVPIIHEPTFSADETPTLLLLAIITIGAALLDSSCSSNTIEVACSLSRFLARNLRWEIFMDTNFQPPSKLWIFQALILLEFYEKMYSTRELHERAHIHHATSIQLMRRGRSLIGKSSAVLSPNLSDDADTETDADADASRPEPSSKGTMTPTGWWEEWITTEVTRRTAFAAFVLDSLHATMFGHSAIMVADELRIPLPCHDSLWHATSSAEVGRIEATLRTHNIRQVPFLEGLRRTLNGRQVQASPFGRIVLMAGLLNVSWHMNQRDLQVNVLGRGQVGSPGAMDEWPVTLTRAYDTWKADGGMALRQSGTAANKSSQLAPGVVNEFEVRGTLHHLAHMAMNADIVDLQIFARTKRLLGRSVTMHEFKAAETRVKETWAPSSKARNATYYALKLLLSVLVPERNRPSLGSPVASSPYSAAEDLQLNRPWVLYFAALVVWSYGHAICGPCQNVSIPTSEQERVQQMSQYLVQFGSVMGPNELRIAKGLNENVALLLVLRDMFKTTRWELLHEGAQLLDQCIMLSTL